MDTLPEGFAARLQRRELVEGTIVAEKYRLRSFLGDGAMGQVFLADNTSIGLPVAIKLLKPELLANPEFRRRFQQEAQAVAAVEHPNVARFFDLVIGDPTFLVMEYVRGPTLAAVLANEGRLSVERAVRLAAHIAWGLDAAHAVHVVHRDMKPANVVLSPDRQHGEVPKVIDFGLAKLAQTASTSQLTRSGQIIGTPHYMAPEQIEGRDVDARSDVYALGCVLYEMLTGRPPFAEVREDVQILYRQLHEIAVPPSALAPEVSPAIDEVVARAMAKAPGQRFASMREMAEALEQALAPPPPAPRATTAVAAEPTQAIAAVAPPASRPVHLVAGALLLVVGMVAGVVVARQRMGGSSTAPATAAAPSAAVTSLLVVTQPPGAAVEVDGRPWGERTPTAIGGLAPGEHEVRIALDGHMAIERWVSVEDGARASLQLVLQPASRSVHVRTVPSGAMLFLDDRLVAAASPATITVDEGDFHELRAEKLGFEPAIVHLAPEDRDPELQLVLEAEKQPRGYVLIDADAVASVMIDGVETGFETPTLGIRVAAGEHVIELIDPSGRKSPPVKVVVRQGETVRIKLSMTEQPQPPGGKP